MSYWIGSKRAGRGCGESSFFWGAGGDNVFFFGGERSFPFNKSVRFPFLSSVIGGFYRAFILGLFCGFLIQLDSLVNHSPVDILEHNIRNVQFYLFFFFRRVHTFDYFLSQFLNRIPCYPNKLLCHLFFCSIMCFVSLWCFLKVWTLNFLDFLHFNYYWSILDVLISLYTYY